jgi:hypothetical protein
MDGITEPFVNLRDTGLQAWKDYQSFGSAESSYRERKAVRPVNSMTFSKGS